MTKPPVTEECAQLIRSLIEDVDKCIISDIRQHVAKRDMLLTELDVLERVRERLIARLDD